MSKKFQIPNSKFQTNPKSKIQNLKLVTWLLVISYWLFLTSPFPASAQNDNLSINAPSFIVTDAKSDEVILERNSDIQRPIASLTKIMTAVVFLENNPGWNKRVTIKKEDVAIGAALAVRTGDVIKVKDLFYAMLVRSANNAAKALARSTDLTRPQFVNQMNVLAKKLGMNKTVFTEPSGLDAGNQSTAGDYDKLARYALAKPEIAKATILPSYVFKPINKKKNITVVNANKMLKSPFNIIGTKTGYTDEAGRCLLVRAKDQTGREIIAVTLGGQKTGEQWKDMDKLLTLVLAKNKIIAQK